MKNKIVLYNYFYWFFSSIMIILICCGLLNNTIYSKFELAPIIVIVYCISCFLLKRIIFNEEHIEIFYPTRIFKRKKVIEYQNVKYVYILTSPRSRECRIYIHPSGMFYLQLPVFEFTTIDNIFLLLKTKGVMVKANTKEYCTNDYNDK